MSKNSRFELHVIDNNKIDNYQFDIDKDECLAGKYFYSDFIPMNELYNKSRFNYNSLEVLAPAAFYRFNYANNGYIFNIIKNIEIIDETKCLNKIRK